MAKLLPTCTPNHVESLKTGRIRAGPAGNLWRRTWKLCVVCTKTKASSGQGLSLSSSSNRDSTSPSQTFSGASTGAVTRMPGTSIQRTTSCAPPKAGESCSAQPTQNLNSSRPRVLPNSTLNRSANGRPPGPGRRYTVHCLRPGPGVLPLSPG
jgi:hypothetical protein